MRSFPVIWTLLMTKLGIARKTRQTSSQLGYHRTHRFERCEDRRMLATYTVNSLIDTVNFSLFDSEVSLREAVFRAEQDPTPDTIDFDPAVFDEPKTITLTEGELSITESVTIDATIDGDGPSEELLGITIDAGNGTDGQFNTQDGFRIFNISSGSGEVEINGLTLTGADPNMSGGAIYSGSNLTVRNTVITGNAGSVGGGIYSYASNLTIEGSTLTGNSTFSSNGGGVRFNAGFFSQPHQMSVVSSEISGNVSATGGGGIYAYGYQASVDIQSSSITGNHSQILGGGLYFKGLDLNIQSSMFVDNEAGGSGGALSAKVTDGTISIDQSTFDTNTMTGFNSNGAGATLHVYNTTLSITKVTITNNEALGIEANVGGLEVVAKLNSNILIDSTKIADNHADDDVAGLAIQNFDSVVTVRNSTISGNTDSQNNASAVGGGVYLANSDGGSATIEYSTISENRNTTSPDGIKENVSGGGLFLIGEAGCTTTIRNSTVSGNEAEGYGGGIYIAGGGQDVFILHSTIYNNRADSEDDGTGTGGGIYNPFSGTPVTIEHTIIAGNFQGSGSTRDDIKGQAVGAAWSFIGDNTGATITDNGGNQIGTGAMPKDPNLAPLDLHGGLTKTHMPNATSLVIDMGNPSATAGGGGTPDFDQRGDPYVRIYDGDGTSGSRIDIGAVEVQPIASNAPQIVDVLLDGSGWTGADPYSYADIVSTGSQLAPIFTQGVDTIEIAFSEDVIMPSDGSALKLWRSDDSGQYSVGIAEVDFDQDNYDYDSNTHIATWTFDSVLPADKYRIELDATLVENTSGVLLDGDWFDTDLTASDTPDGFSDDDDPVREFPTGDGVPGTEGGKFRFHFALLPGDYNQDGLVLASGSQSDLLVNGDGDGDGDATGDAGDDAIVTGNAGKAIAVRNREGSNTRGGDYNDDDKVDEFDFLYWRDRFGQSASLPDDGKGADGNGNGTIDAADYTVWRDNKFDYSAWTDAPLGGGSGAGSGPIVQFGVAPTVINVIISGSNSTHDPYSFESVVGSGEQLRTVPVGGADTISIKFSEDVNVSASSLAIVGLQTANRPTLAEFGYDIMTQTGTWRFEGWAPGDQYLILLNDSITDIEGDRLDGEWTNPASLSTTNSLVSTFPSGDGTGGGSFNFVATLLPGDANLDLVVNSSDYAIWSSHAYQYSGDGIFEYGDFDGNGYVDTTDLMFYYANQYSDLTNLSMLGDLNGDWTVDDQDLEILEDNWNLSNPTWADGDLDGDGDITMDDVDLMFAQYGLGLSVVS